MPPHAFRPDAPAHPRAAFASRAPIAVAGIIDAGAADRGVAEAANPANPAVANAAVETDAGSTGPSDPVGRAGTAAPDRRVAGERLAFLDLFKAVASQLIVLHHLAFYGPMAHRARPLAPGLVDWLDAHARIAVQVFLVIGGFLAARSMAPDGVPRVAAPLAAIRRRFGKTVPPYLAAIGLAVLASAIARDWMSHDSISAPPHVVQLLAHALLLHDVLGFEALSAGVWYVAIDFQLYALLTLLLWAAGRLGRSSRRVAAVTITLAVAASLTWFNRDADWDVWAPYFFGSYGLGVLAWWLADPARSRTTAALLLAAMLATAIGALAIDFRARIAVALATALVLAVLRRDGSLPAARASGGWLGGALHGPRALGASRPVAWLGRISYSVFLVHFPSCLVVNAAFTRFAPADPEIQAMGLLIAWGASVAVGAAFHRWIERPLGRLGAGRSSAGSRAPAQEHASARLSPPVRSGSATAR